MSSCRYNEFGSSVDEDIPRESIVIPDLKRKVIYILFGVLVGLLLIVLLVTGVKFSQVNQEITDIKQKLETIHHSGSDTQDAHGNKVEVVYFDKAAVPVRGACQEGWISFKTSCYFLSTTTASWSAAEQKCISYGGHLVVMNNVEELDYISTVVEVRESYWIGLVERKTEGHWSWVDGMNFNSTRSYWDVGQPDDWDYRENGEDCGQLHGSQKLQRKLWNDADCTLVYRFICEKKTHI